MHDTDVLAAIGAVVVEAATLEYGAAVLVAVFEGHRGTQVEHRATAIAKKTGRAMRELDKLAKAHPARHDLQRIAHDAQAVLDERHVIAHSIAVDDAQIGDQPALVMWNPRYGTEAEITTPDLMDHARDIRLVFRHITNMVRTEMRSP
jgi:hypothetical protein